MPTPSPIAPSLGTALTDVELAELRYFHCVASTCSFARGAQLAHVSASAISKAIKRLESALGVELLRRTTRRVHVTEAGEMLMAYCDRILGAVDELSAELDARRGHLRGTLRVGATEVFAAHALPATLADLSEAHPELLVKTFHVDDDAVERALIEGRVDVGLSVGPSKGGVSDSVSSELLVRSRGVVVCGATHPLASRGEINDADLSEHAFVVPQALGHEHRTDLDGFPSPTRKIGATVELLSMAMAMVVSGRFLGFFPRVAVSGKIDGGSMQVLHGLSGGQSFELHALTRAGEERRPSTAALVDALRQTLQAALGVDQAA